MSEKIKLADLIRKVKVGASTYYLREGDTPVRVIKHKNVSENGVIDFASIEPDMIQSSERSTENILEAGDILIACRGSSPKVALVPEEAKGYYFSADFFALSLKPGIINPEIIEAYLSLPSVQQYLAQKSSGRTLFTISRSDILDLEIIIPPKDKQDRLVELASLIKEKYAIMEQEKRCLESLKTAVLSTIVGGDEEC